LAADFSTVLPAACARTRASFARRSRLSNMERKIFRSRRHFLYRAQISTFKN
jgi:hypothetical protein